MAHSYFYKQPFFIKKEMNHGKLAEKNRGLPSASWKRSARRYTARVLEARKNHLSHMQKAVMDKNQLSAVEATENPWQAWNSYVTDSAQRSVLFWDTLRERGNTYLEHVKAGSPPLLAFEWEIVSDGRKFERPVNYALIRIIPPAGVKVNDTQRPFIIIDPRAGHGPGIGGFKKDSEVGVALEFGHPVYFIIFFPDPEPGQTILDVNRAETKFLDTVIQRHPASPKPTIYGNCQGGWASMLIAANDPHKVGPIVINGAPMSYWSGSWSGGEGENPMRYSGGLLGGSWTSLLPATWGTASSTAPTSWRISRTSTRRTPSGTSTTTSGRTLIRNRERFLEFEKWWGGYFLMNEEEIRWIVENLFIGNKLARGEVKAAPGTYIDLKAIRSPIVIFSSKGTTSRRRSRQSTGSPTSTRARLRSRRTDRSSSRSCMRTWATWAFLFRERSPRKSTLKSSRPLTTWKSSGPASMSWTSRKPRARARTNTSPRSGKCPWRICGV